MLLKIATTRDVDIPSRGHATDAGVDFRCPKFDTEFLEDLISKEANKNINWKTKPKRFIVPPGENITIPSGVKVEIPYGYMGLFLNKSGVASKHDVVIGAQVIDTFYSGEVHIDLHNVGTDDFVVEENMKLAQMVIIPILNCDITICEENDLYDWMKSNSYRDEGGFGSTGK
jgi:dUTP pyrophosphatase